MQFLLFLFAFLLCGGTSFSQNFEFTGGDSLVRTFEIDDLTSAHTKIKNLSDSTVIFKWEIITNEHPAGWEFTLCDFPFCYTGGEITGTMFPADALSEMAFLTVSINATYPDIGFYQIVVWDQEFEDAKDTLTVTMIATPAYSSLEKEMIDPKPSFIYNSLARDLTLNNPTDKPVQFTIWNYTGQIVQSPNIAAGSQRKIQTSNFANGLYIIRYQNAADSFEVEKLIIP